MKKIICLFGVLVLVFSSVGFVFADSSDYIVLPSSISFSGTFNDSDEHYEADLDADYEEYIIYRHGTNNDPVSEYLGYTGIELGLVPVGPNSNNPSGAFIVHSYLGFNVGPGSVIKLGFDLDLDDIVGTDENQDEFFDAFGEGEIYYDQNNIPLYFDSYQDGILTFHVVEGDAWESLKENGFDLSFNFDKDLYDTNPDDEFLTAIETNLCFAYCSYSDDYEDVYFSEDSINIDLSDYSSFVSSFCDSVLAAVNAGHSFDTETKEFDFGTVSFSAPSSQNGVIEATGSVFSIGIGFVSTVVDTITSHPLLLIFAILSLVGLGVGMTKRLINL